MNNVKIALNDGRLAMIPGQPVLVTGSHRSGTTWVGKMIASSSSVGYIQEPFLPGRRPGICAVTFPYTFAYVTDDNGAAFYDHMKATLSFQFQFGAALTALKTPRDVAIMLKYGTQFFFNHARQAIPLVKDPLAVFSAEWLARSFGMRVIVMIRHPAAFAYSVRRMNWKHDFSHFLQQPLLMRDYLHPFEAEIRAFAQTEQDILDQAALLWKLIYSVVLTYQQAHPEWIFLRHEDVASDPVVYFESLFQNLGLDFSPRIRQVIEDYSNATNPANPRRGTARFGKRHSKALIQNWKQKLTPEEIARLRHKVGDVADAFYQDSEW
jgi:hypothetical protein